jgi:molybdopterin-binding protein
MSPNFYFTSIDKKERLMLKLENISISVGSFEMKDISFEVQRGDYFVILGLSGVGKSLLLETIAGLIKPTAGKMFLNEKEITHENIQNRKMSIVYQDADLFPHMTVFENITYPIKNRKDKTEQVLKIADQVGVKDFLKRKPGTLSGGEYQRVSLARSLAAGNQIFLLDEPLASLDSKSKSELRALLRKLNRNGITIIHVTHDYEEAISLASKIGIMENGKIVHVGSPTEIFKHPKSEFIAHFIGTKNFFKGELKKLPETDLKEFISNGIKIFCLSELPDGEAFLTIDPNEITISINSEIDSSRNRFKGKIVDIAPVRLGIEVTVDIGTELISAISLEARHSLNLDIGKEVWMNFKASSCKTYN